MSAGFDRLQQHVAECDDCRREELPIERIDALLGSSRVGLDTTSMSRQTLSAARGALHRLAVRRYWRQVAAVIVVALLPLPVVLAYDAVLLRLLHAAASSLLSSTLASYITFTYASTLLFLFAASYAAIPVLLARTMLPRLSTHG